MGKYEEVSIASRTFTLASLLGLSFVLDGSLAVRVVLIIAVVAAMATYVSLVTALSPAWTLTGEMLVVGHVIGLELPTSLVLLPYPVVLALLAGLARGWVGAAVVWVAEVVAVVMIPSAATGFTEISDDTTLLAPWLSTSLAMGVVGAAAKRLTRFSTTREVDATYLSARRLLAQLHVVTRRLSAGLDATEIATQLISRVESTISASAVAVFVRSDHDLLVPIGYAGAAAEKWLQPDDFLLREAWASMKPEYDVAQASPPNLRHRLVLPLHTGSHMIGVVSCALGNEAERQDIATLSRCLEDYSLRLDTAMLFQQIQAIAKNDERQRIAREIHDGIAQEVASLGYLIDDLVADAKAPGQAEQLRSLRAELTRVVGELRLSIFDLRSAADSNTGLGVALSEYVSQLGKRTNMKVHLSLDEATTRLPAAVESELFRVAQEAITNARKHSRARNLWVDCWIKPPSARLEIRDDGAGLGLGRPDSYGLSIMRERAERINAKLCVESKGRGPQGTTITVTVGPLSGAVEVSGDAV